MDKKNQKNIDKLLEADKDLNGTISAKIDLLVNQANNTDPTPKSLNTDFLNEDSVKDKSKHININIQPEPDPQYKNLVLSGGSVKGIAHIGALKKLVDEKLIVLNKLKAVAATSVGSLFALLIVLGFSIEEIWNFILYLDMKKMVNPDFFLFLKKCGFDNGQIIYNLFEEILTKKTNIKHINFRQLHELTKIHLTVVGSCLTTKEPVYYDHINTPNFKVSITALIVTILSNKSNLPTTVSVRAGNVNSALLIP